MISILKKITSIIDKVLLTAGVLCLIGIIVSVTSGIISRRIFNSPFTWTEELSTFLFIIVSFIGAACCSYRQREIIVDYFLHKIPDRLKKPIFIGSRLLILLFLGMVVIGGIILVPRMAMSVSVALSIPRSWYYVPVLISAITIFLIYLTNMLELFIGKSSTGIDSEGKEGVG